MREVLTRYGRHNIGFLWVFAENFLFTSAVVSLWLLTHSSTIRSLDIISFSVLGYSFVLVWRNCVNRVVKAVQPNRSLLYHRQVKIFDIYVARILLELISTSGSFIFIYLIMLTFGYMNWPANEALFLLGWFSLYTISFSIALIVGPWSESSELLDRVWHILTYILFPLSGAFFAVDWLPHTAQQVILYIPLVHSAEMIRGGYYGITYKAYYDLNYVLFFVLTCFIIGMLLIKNLSKNVEME
jgi:capsular polysaccharide transport system permease protein